MPKSVDLTKEAFGPIEFVERLDGRKNNSVLYRVRCKACEHEWEGRGAWLAHFARKGVSKCPECGRRANANAHLKLWQVRRRDMAARWERGETLQAIGDAHNVSRERVRQILVKAGVSTAAVRKALAQVPVGRLVDALCEHVTGKQLRKILMATVQNPEPPIGDPT